MGIFSDAIASMRVQKIKIGGTTNLSLSQITCLIVNMPDARKNLSDDEFQMVYSLYKYLRKCKTRMTLDINGYFDTAAKIVMMFNRLAPYGSYCGGNQLEAEFLLSELNKTYSGTEFAADIIGQIKEHNM